MSDSIFDDPRYTGQGASAITSAPAPITPTAAGIYGAVGASLGNVASALLDRAAAKVAGVSTTPPPPAPAVRDSANAASMMPGGFSLNNPLVLAGAILAGGLVLIALVNRR